MKKILKVAAFGSTSDAGQLIAYRRKKTLYVQNVTFDPPERFVVKHDADNGKISIEITLAENEYVSINDGSGMAEKQQIEGR